MRSDYPARYQGKNPITKDGIALNYRTAKEQLNIVTVSKDFYQIPDRYGFVQSPRTPDRTRSLKLYPTNTFCDFANGKTGGDAVRFLAYVRGISNRDALDLLCRQYGIMKPEEDPQKNEELMKQIREKNLIEEQKKQRSAAFRASLLTEIDRLKAWTEKCSAALQNPEIEPFSDLWCSLVSEKEHAEEMLDLLTAVPGNGMFYRMKPDESSDMPSDRPTWTMTALQILETAGRFTATAEEMERVRRAIEREMKRNPHVKCRREVA